MGAFGFLKSEKHDVIVVYQVKPPHDICTLMAFDFKGMAGMIDKEKSFPLLAVIVKGKEQSLYSYKTTADFRRYCINMIPVKSAVQMSIFDLM